MKLVIDGRFIGKSGIGTYIDNLVDELCKFHHEHDYLIIAEQGRELNYHGSNVSILYTDIQPFSLKELFLFPKQEINHCDAFFSPYINIPGGINIPVFTTIHDVIFFDVDGIVSPIGKSIRKWYYKRAIKNSKSIFTVSEFSKQRIQYHFKADKEIIVISNGISEYIKDYPIELCRECEDYYIYVGNIKPHKGLKTLIIAFMNAKREGLKSKLLIVGNAEKIRTIDSSIYNMVADVDYISFTGWVSDEKLIRYISRAKALVLPSFYEGFGIPPLEAMYLGTPAIVSNIPVLKEIYKDLPVTFFEVGNCKDLKNKLLGIKTSFDSIEEIRQQIDEKHNFAKSADMILSTIRKDIGL